MKSRSSLHRNFFRRAEIRCLVPDLKLLLAVLTIGCDSNAGAYLPGGLGDDSGLEAAALAGGLLDLEKRGLIVRDMATGEIFLTHFYRDNTYSNPARRIHARDDFERVESMALRQKILAAVAKNPDCGLTAADLDPSSQLNQSHPVQAKLSEAKQSKGKQSEAAPPSASPSSGPGSRERETKLHGVIVADEKDREGVEELAQKFGAEAVEATASHFPKPWLSMVRKALSAAIHINRQEALEANNDRVVSELLADFRATPTVFAG